MDEAEELAKLERLREAETISRGEYERQRARVLAGKKANPATKWQMRLGCGCLTVIAAIVLLSAIGWWSDSDKGSSPTPATSATASSVPPKQVANIPASALPIEDVRESFLQAYADFKGDRADCNAAIDRAGQAMADADRTGSRIDVYASMREARDTCAAAEGIKDSPMAKQPDILPTTLNVCSEVFASQRRAMDVMMEAVDSGDTRPSKLIDARDALALANETMPVCLNNWHKSAKLLKVKLPS